jgi:hypothetical protein
MQKYERERGDHSLSFFVFEHFEVATDGRVEGDGVRTASGSDRVAPFIVGDGPRVIAVVQG